MLLGQLRLGAGMAAAGLALLSVLTLGPAPDRSAVSRIDTGMTPVPTQMSSYDPTPAATTSTSQPAPAIGAPAGSWPWDAPSPTNRNSTSTPTPAT